ncbi:CapA family protein [Streptomyces lavendulae]|uniref:CapA family protein n=1 Tax=Streptomyces lavendulae TaxID=1914 RepID=UPI00372332EA
MVAVSIHWGSNWGYRVPPEHVRFAHALVDGGADLVHGHSSHHPRPLEVYRGRLILYGCGDLVDDYEGITGHKQYRDDLRLLYTARLDKDTGALRGLRLTPFQGDGPCHCHVSGATDFSGSPDRAGSGGCAPGSSWWPPSCSPSRDGPRSRRHTA